MRAGKLLALVVLVPLLAAAQRGQAPMTAPMAEKLMIW
jgi:hypothetical protein